MPRRITPLSVRVGAASEVPESLREQLDRVLRSWEHSGDHSDQTRTRMGESVHRFVRRLEATGVQSLDAVKPGDARRFITAPTREGRSPEVSTQHARRTALRVLFRTARELGLSNSDPTLDVQLPPRGQRAARPLTDDEVTLCRAAARTARGRSAAIRSTAWALGESTAISSEITAIRISDLDDPENPSAVRLPGTRRHDARSVPLTPWASAVIRTRVQSLLAAGAPSATLLAYGGAAPPGGAKAQAAVCNALSHVLDAAGLLAEPDVRPASLRNWAGRAAFDAGASLQQVARRMGLRSLDAAAEDIALRWRPEEVVTEPS